MAKVQNPYSALFDYEQLAREEEERKRKLQQGQGKIMRTNAVGDALRLIVDAIGGSKGASIIPRPVNQGILQASQRYNALEDQSSSNMDRLRLQDLAVREKGIQYGAGLEAEQRGTARDLAKEQRGRGYQLEDQARKRTEELEDLSATKAHQKEMVSLSARYAKDLENVRSANDRAEIERRYQGEIEKVQARYGRSGALSAKGLFEVSRYDTPSTDAIISRNQVVGMLDDLKKYLASKGVYTSQMPRVLQTNETRGKISDDDLKFLIGTYKEFFQPRLPELTGGTPSTGVLKQPTDKDVLQMFYETIGKTQAQPGTIIAPPDTEQKLNIIRPDKKGITDLSILFN